MWRKTWIAAAALFGALTLQARPNQGTGVTLTVSVFNDAEMPQAVLQEAEERAEAVFHQAGISLTWLDCGTVEPRAVDMACSILVFPVHLSVRLLRNGPRLSGDVFGESFLDDSSEGNYAFVYSVPLASSPALARLSKGKLLGYVVAHELGHLLLGPDSHSTAGIMRAVWQFGEIQQAAQGRLYFSPSEAERLRTRLSMGAGRSTRTAAPRRGCCFCA